MAKTTTKARKAATKAASKAKAPAKAKKLTAAQADKITSSTGNSNGETHYVTSAGGETFSFPTARWSGELRAATAVGSSFKAAKELWSKLSVAKLAKGVSSKDAPHSSKSVQDAAAKAKPAKPAKPTVAQRKAASKAKADADDGRKLSLTEKGEAKLAKLSAADRKKDKLQRMVDAGTIAKVLDGVASRGDVNYALRTGVMAAA